MASTKFILARKKGMTQFFREDGTVVPVTVLEAGPCTVTDLRTIERDTYTAVQLGFVPARENGKHVNKPQLKSFEKNGTKAFRVLREFRVDDLEGFEVGGELTAETFEVGDMVDVTANSKGRGFAGTIKRHGFRRGPETHGSRNVRAPGSIGQCAYPGRVFKGQRMPGHFGNKRITVKNSIVEGIHADLGLILVRGGVPGPPNGLVQLVTAKTGVKK